MLMYLDYVLNFHETSNFVKQEPHIWCRSSYMLLFATWMLTSIIKGILYNLICSCTACYNLSSLILSWCFKIKKDGSCNIVDVIFIVYVMLVLWFWTMNITVHVSCSNILIFTINQIKFSHSNNHNKLHKSTYQWLFASIQSLNIILTICTTV